MRKIISIFTIALLTIGFSTEFSFAKELSAKKIQRQDKRMTKKKAKIKRFRTQKEYNRLKHKIKVGPGRSSKHNKMSDMFNARSGKRVQEIYVEDDYYYDWDYPRGPRQHGYRHFKRGWYLAYRYDRASFYDNYGYEYGYFNKYGFEFDGIFYRYDRYYRYQDRLRGRGLFNNRYYIPVSASKYGFCSSAPKPYPRRLKR